MSERAFEIQVRRDRVSFFPTLVSVKHFLYEVVLIPVVLGFPPVKFLAW